MYYVFVVLGSVCFDGISHEFVELRFAWFSGKRTFIDGGVYMCFNGGVASRVISSVFMWFCIFIVVTKCFFLYQGFLKIV